MGKFVVRNKIRINASPEVVWEALTDPEKTKKYFYKCRVYSDWKVGSPIAFKGTMFFFFKFEMNGVILEIQPGKLLKYILKNSNSSGISTVTDKLTYENGVTTLSVSDDVGQGGGAQKRYKKSVEGWKKILIGLRRFIESENNATQLAH